MKQDRITITLKFINKNRTKNGAWKRSQLEIIGVSWPPSKGWKYRAIGKTLSIEEAEKFQNISLDTY